jgi:hypothetical protein
MTTHYANDMLFAVTEGNNGYPVTPGNFTWSGSPVTPTAGQFLDAVTTTGKIQGWYAVAAATGTYTANGSIGTADNYSGIMVAYRPPPVAGGQNGSMMLRGIGN